MPIEDAISNPSVTQKDLQGAESTICDVDEAGEMMACTKNDILAQSAHAGSS